MDFDEYDYLEKMVENPELPKQKEPLANGNGARSEERDRSKISKNRAQEHHSKRVRSEDDDPARDHDRHRERGSLRHRSSPDQRSRDGEKDRHRSGREHRDRDRDREERNGRDREKEPERVRDQDRDRIRERGREIDGVRERERERSHRSRSHSERHHDEERERNSEKSKDMELTERVREQEQEKEKEKEREPRGRERDSRRYKEKKEGEPEVDPERDQRTVFAYQINLKADERDVYEFFSRAGKVRDVRLIMDRNSRRSKGVGYIEFYDAMSVPMAIALTGQNLQGQAVMVKPSEAEKNLVQSNTAASGGTGGLVGTYSGGARRLYVGNLHFNITEDQLRQVFESFGTVELVQLPVDPDTGHCKGFGFVQFARLEDARAAQSLNGQLDIAGRTIKVSTLSDQPGMQDIGANAGDFDDDEGGGLSINARSRAILMQKLDRSGTATSVVGALTAPVANNPALPAAMASVLGVPPVFPSVPGLVGLPGSVLPVAAANIPPVDTIGPPTECLLLKNMFDPNVETEPDFDMDIEEDVQDECTKFGTVKHIFVDKNSAGHVYLRFDSADSAIKAQGALHGRWFAGKMITATFMLPQNYEAKFHGSS